MRARFLDLAPDGFEEQETDEGVELAAYGESAMRVIAAFPRACTEQVEPGWEERWREFHHGVRVGALWVGPPWETPPADAIAVVIDPGRAFGTGAHPTTRLCLELLLEQERCGVLDVGCGSGVLAIAAAKLGHADVLAVDVDESAVAATRQNAEANGVTLGVQLLDASSGWLPEGELALANIALHTVEAIGERLTSSRVVTSGYLVADRPQLAGFAHLGRRELDGWAADLHERR
ncbi:MAG TPA: 50S ribosomal protein L11 methyltransferase [Gaiellaceae bacterium]|jgi:ribosomal protein L11 methyltransferase